METINKVNLTEKVAEIIKDQVGISKMPAVDAMRKKAFDTFSSQQIPNRRHEEWKYSTPEPLFKQDLSLALSRPIEKSSIDKIKLPFNDAHLVVTINGYYNEQLSTPELRDKLTVCNLKEAFKLFPEVIEKHITRYADAGDIFVAMNNAAYTSGTFISLKDNQHIDKTIYVLNITSTDKNILINSRNLFLIGNNASMTIVEHFESIDSSGRSVRNHVTEVLAGENSQAIYDVIQNDCENCSAITNTWVLQHRSSNFTINTLSFGGQYTRNNLNIVHDNEGIESHLNGLFMGTGSQLIDNHTLVDHQKPNCQSNELYKGIMNDKSTGVFNGKIFVRKDAQKTNAYQSSRNILLSDQASINTKPQLEIYADDVKCSHGTSTGQMDEEAVFYLQARGIGKDSAKLLLMHAFAGEVLDKIENEVVKAFAETLVNKKLGA